MMADNGCRCGAIERLSAPEWVVLVAPNGDMHGKDACSASTPGLQTDTLAEIEQGLLRELDAEQIRNEHWHGDNSHASQHNQDHSDGILAGLGFALGMIQAAQARYRMRAKVLLSLTP